jgi:hypothetical protein
MNKPGIVAHLCIPSLRRVKQENHELKASLGYIVRPCLKKKKNQAGNVAQEVENLPSKAKT